MLLVIILEANRPDDVVVVGEPKGEPAELFVDVGLAVFDDFEVDETPPSMIKSATGSSTLVCVGLISLGFLTAIPHPGNGHHFIDGFDSTNAFKSK